jgi:putative restriction endonuclease
VRAISPVDFDHILALGLDENETLLPRVDQPLSGFAEDQTPFAFDQERERLTLITSRLVRDRVFRRVVLRAYDERCAVTGLKLINGGGRAEVAAAHIRPVAAHGPDIVGNGIALSGTAHWMFDRGLISLSGDLDILVSRQANDPDGIRSFINKTGRAFAPMKLRERPHPPFLKWHRENCFKQ